MRKFLSSALAAGILSSLAAPALAAGRHKTPPVFRPYPAPVTIAGSVHGPDGVPIDGAFIQVRDGVSSAVTGVDGRFDLLAEPHEGRTLVVTAVGYKTAQVPLAHARSITLEPLPVYRPAEIPPPPPEVAADESVFDTQVSGAYRTRYQSYAANGRGITGWADNEFGIDARYRAADWVFGLEGHRNRVPYDIQGLSPQPSTAPEVEQSSWNLSAGPVFDLWGLELLPRLVFANRYCDPSGTNGTPWTGTPLDFSQTELAGEVSLDLGYRLGPVTAVIDGSRSFVEATTLTGAPYGPTDVGLNEGGITLSYTVIPGLRADLAYQRTFDVGVPGTHLDQWADVIGLGLTYLPAQVQP